MWDTEFLFNRHVSGISELDVRQKGTEAILKNSAREFSKTDERYKTTDSRSTTNLSKTHTKKNHVYFHYNITIENQRDKNLKAI